MTGETKWTCGLCNATMRASNKGNHVRWKCPKQGNMLKALERQEAAAKSPPPPKYFQYLPCACGCGEQVGQIKGAKKKHFLDTEHYENWRALQRSAQVRENAMAEAEDAKERGETEAAKRREAEEMAPILARGTAAKQAAQTVPMVTGEASFRLWARCLGFNAGDAAPVAA